MGAPIAFIVPGPIDQITGGYLYDRRIVDGLRAQGRPVELIELPGRFPKVDALASAAASDALARQPDRSLVVIDGLALPAFETALPAAKDRLGLFVLVHHSLALETGLGAQEAAQYAAFERRLLPLCRGILCPSARSAADVSALGVDAARIAVVPPGTDRQHGRPRARPRDPAAPIRLLSVGSLIARKGHHLLIEALGDLARRDWRLTLIGSLDRDPRAVAEIEATISRRALGRHVRLVGEWPPETLDRAYRTADVFVLPSYYEGYGMAYAEAMAHGLPIIGTDAGAIPETVPLSAGILVPAGDRSALSAALERMIGDGDRRKAYGAGALAAAAQLRDWAQASRDWVRALDGLAGRF